MTSPRIQKARKGQTSVPLSSAARRRIRVAVALMDYVAANIDRLGSVTIPAGHIVAKDADGNVTVVDLAEISEFVDGLQRAGKAALVEQRPTAYTFKVIREASTGAPKRPAKPTAAGLPEPQVVEQMLRNVLYAVEGGASRFAAVRAAVAKAFGHSASMPARQTSAHGFESRLGTCIEHLKALGYIQREGRALLILPSGRARFQESRPFEGEEIPKKFRSAYTLSAAVRTPDAVSSGDVGRLLEMISTLPPEKLITIWSNAVKVLATPSKASDHPRARKAIEAVETAWDALDIGKGEEFAWPSTDVRGGPGTSTVPEFRSEGMLSYLEYRVGKTAGLSAVVRQSILARVFEGKLPRVFDADYMRRWGTPGTALRLRKMAESLAAFARNAKRSDEDRFEEAIRQWEQDLEFLHDRYYVGRFGFGWPTTSINDPVRILLQR